MGYESYLRKKIVIRYVSIVSFSVTDFSLVYRADISKATAHKRIRHLDLPEIRWKFSGFSCPATVKVVLIKSVQRRS
jgi:hypothetical protein